MRGRRGGDDDRVGRDGERVAGRRRAGAETRSASACGAGGVDVGDRPARRRPPRGRGSRRGATRSGRLRTGAPARLSARRRPGGADEPRTRISTGHAQVPGPLGARARPSARAGSSTARSAWKSSGWATVVSEIRLRPAIAMSSNPTTDRSRGIDDAGRLACLDQRRSRAKSFQTNTAVGASGPRSALDQVHRGAPDPDRLGARLPPHRRAAARGRPRAAPPGSRRGGRGRRWPRPWTCARSRCGGGRGRPGAASPGGRPRGPAGRPSRSTRWRRPITTVGTPVLRSDAGSWGMRSIERQQQEAGDPLLEERVDARDRELLVALDVAEHGRVARRGRAPARRPGRAGRGRRCRGRRRARRSSSCGA